MEKKHFSSKKCDKTPIKRQYFNDYEYNYEICFDIFDGQFEVCLQDDGREKQHTFHGCDEQQRLLPFPVLSVAEEDAVDHRVDHRLEQEIQDDDAQVYKYKVIVNTK